LSARSDLNYQNAGGFITENKEINLLNLYKLNPHLLEEIRLPDRVAHTVGFVRYEFDTDVETNNSHDLHQCL